MRVYLDWNATTPPLPAALEATRLAAELHWANPSSVHADGRAAAKTVEDARAQVASLLDADPRDVLFTSGGTEANNLAIRTALARPGKLVVSPLEHPSSTKVSPPARVRRLAVRAEGVIDLDDLARALAEGPVAGVVLQTVNHETGVLQPVADAIATVNVKAPGTWIHVDVIQSVGKLSREHQAFGATSRSVAAHKIRGPKGIGALVTLPRAKVLPVLLGGAQERGIRPGTVPAPLAAGFGAAARHAATSAAGFAATAPLRDALEAALVELGARVNGAGPRAPHVVNAYVPNWYGPELVAALDLEGVSVASGSACSAGTMEPSPVIEAMFDRERAQRSVRFSLGETTTEADVQAAIAALRRVVPRAG